MNMTYAKKYFIEITALDKISTDKVYLALSKNFEKSFIKLFEIADEYTFKDVKI
jgi:hypothetical protein